MRLQTKKIIGKGFDKRPQNINKNGRPRGFVSQVIKDLADLGIENVKPSQVIDLYEKLMNCTVAKLTELAQNESNSWEVRQTAKYMLKHPEKAWNEVKDRAHGKAVQQLQSRVEGKIEVETYIMPNGTEIKF